MAAQVSSDGCKALYVGNLDPRVTEEMLQQIFSVISPVGNVKIIRDRNYTHGGFNYGFVEFNEHTAAEQALQAMTGRSVFGQEIRVNWAAQGSAQKEDTTGHYHIFVGDLSPEVTDEVLTSAFTPFRTLSEARVMWDQSTGKSRGFGFVAFRERADAEQAIATMNGEWLGSRAIRCNWANQKNTGAAAATQASTPYLISQNMSYEQIFAQTSPYHTIVYIGNLPHGITQQDLAPYFQQYGYVSDIRLQSERGFAFVKMDTHANAATAIYALQGFQIHGRPAKLSWGKDRNVSNNNNNRASYDPYSSYNYATATGYGAQNWVQPGAYDMQQQRPAGAGSQGNLGTDGSAAAAAAVGSAAATGWNQQQQQQQQQQYYQQYYSAGHNMNI
ncbi:hypothetical protein BDB00DRAFT_929474 [Zychaea mexicana]|uniref:uncharacterized protein n=1 Tax=Zychaea mexicana TaxID=64656 RepID=UPI0022FE45F1|nr:uncharacterized protein BDB00DRAFT_929474 [Zychaea mexicana]KAI9492853.1 hypothetical protein BDB00DRAFT_929474 [Zychaea mexicana]